MKVGHPTEALLLLAYDELGADEAKTVQAHVDGCPECRATVEGYRAVRRAAAALPASVPSVRGLDSLLHYADKAAARARRRRLTTWASAVLAAATAVALTVVALRPPAQREATLAAAPPASLGPVAANEAKAVEKAQAPRAPALPERREAAPGAAGAAVPQSRAKVAKAEAKHAAEVDAQKEEPTPQQPLAQPAGPLAVAAKARPPAAPSEGAAAVQRVQVVGRVSSASAASPAPLAADSAVASGAALGGAGASAARDGGSAADRDVARRQALLAQLKTATHEAALPLLSELCAIDARLALPEAFQVCSQLVQQYPGTQEAAAAQARLGALRPP